MKIKHLFFAIYLFTTISAFSQIPNTLSPSDKVYGLSKFWQEVNYNFVYLDKVDKTMWNNRYKELISIVQTTKNDYEYFRELEKFCALLKDGHTNIFPPKEVVQMNTMFGDYRLFLQNIEGKAIVVRTNFSKKDEIPVGSEIIEVNGMTAQQYAKENVIPYISSSTDYILQDWSFSGLLRGLQGESFDVKVKKPDSQIISFRLTHQMTKEQEVFPSFDSDKGLLEFKWLGNKIAYIALNSFEDAKIDSLFTNKLPELYEAKGLIIDLRSNGGGNTTIGLDILKYLTNDRTLYGAKSTSRLHIPTFKAWGRFTDPKDSLKSAWSKKVYLSYNDRYTYEFEYEPTKISVKGKKIVVPTAVLIGHVTASAAEDFLIYADNQKHFTKIGEKTFGSTGQPFAFDIVGGISARICTKKDTYSDGREFVGYGIKPDIEVKTTLTDYISKKDPVLDKSIEIITQKLK